MRAEIVKEVEAILGCVRPSASKLRDIRWTVRVAPDVSFTGTNYETENETGTDERNALSRNFFTHGPVPPGLESLTLWQRPANIVVPFAFTLKYWIIVLPLANDNPQGRPPR